MTCGGVGERQQRRQHVGGWVRFICVTNLQSSSWCSAVIFSCEFSQTIWANTFTDTSRSDESSVCVWGVWNVRYMVRGISTRLLTDGEENTERRNEQIVQNEWRLLSPFQPELKALSGLLSVSSSICPPLLSQQFVCLEDVNHLLSFTHFLSPLLLSSPKHVSMHRFFSSQWRALESRCGVKVGDVSKRLSASGRTWTVPPTQRRIRCEWEHERRRCRASHWLRIMEGFWSRSCFVTHDLRTACTLFYSCQTHETKSTLHCYQHRLSKDGYVFCNTYFKVNFARSNMQSGIPF